LCTARNKTRAASIITRSLGSIYARPFIAAR
jgi:hypothetical protein